MENNHRYFKNHSCKYYPCHQQPNDNGFNCLFCYCPLYGLGDKCGGSFEYMKNVKVCAGCHFPHVPENYDIIVAKLKEMNKRGENANSK